MDREAEEKAGTFGARIAALEADAVIDMICFTATSARQLVDALHEAVRWLAADGQVDVGGQDF